MSTASKMVLKAGQSIKLKLTKDKDRPAHLGAITSQTNLSMSYDDAFELTGFGFFNYIALTTCSLIFMHALIEQVAIAYVLDPALCDLKLTIKEKGLIASAIFFGIGSTAICWGSISDHFGRRSVMLPAIFAACIFSFASSMCSSFWPLFILRICTGVMVSGSSATTLVYLGELCTLKHRDLVIAIAVTSVAVIFCLIPLFAWAIVPQKFSFHIGGMLIKPWRVFMWTWNIIGLSGAVMLIILPESPSFLMATKGPFKTLPVLNKIYRWNHRKEGVDFPVTNISTSLSTIHSANHSGIKGTINDILQLFKPPMLRCFLLTHFAMFVVFLLANGVYLWTPSIFNQMVGDISLSVTVCGLLNVQAYSMHGWFFHDDEMNDVISLHAGGMNCNTGEINSMMYVVACGMELVMLVPFLIITFIIETFHNKRILYACVLGPCAICLGLSVLVPQVLVSAGILLIFGICSGSGAAVLSALAVDAFPTSLRALSMCTMYMAGHFGSVVGNTLTAAAVNGPCVTIFLTMASLTGASVVLLLLLWPNLERVREQMEERGFQY